MRKISIAIGDHVIHAELRDTPTAKAIYEQLPFDSSAQTWGDEVYFVTPVNNIALENDAKNVVKLGELAFWVEGNCIAIGFGPTPISHADEIRLAAETNIWAHTTDDLKLLKNVRQGDKVKMTASENSSI